MNKKTRVRRVREALMNFSARGSRCPLCKKSFRHGCNHSVSQARDRLFENYIKAIAS